MSEAPAKSQEKVGCRINITIDDIGTNREFVAEFLKLCARFYPFAQIPERKSLEERK
jgi:hypothetical protein